MKQEIIVYGTKWCGDTIRAFRILKEHQINYVWVDITKNSEGEKLVERINHGCVVKVSQPSYFPINRSWLNLLMTH